MLEGRQALGCQNSDHSIPAPSRWQNDDQVALAPLPYPSFTEMVRQFAIEFMVVQSRHDHNAIAMVEGHCEYVSGTQ